MDRETMEYFRRSIGQESEVWATLERYYGVPANVIIEISCAVLNGRRNPNQRPNINITSDCSQCPRIRECEVYLGMISFNRSFETYKEVFLDPKRANQMDIEVSCEGSGR